MGDEYIDWINRALGLIAPEDDPILRLYESCCGIHGAERRGHSAESIEHGTEHGEHSAERMAQSAEHQEHGVESGEVDDEVIFPLWVHKLGGVVGLKVAAPSSLELWLAGKEHRWPEMKRIQKYFYEALEDQVWRYEADILNLFKLPALDVVKRIVAGEDVDIQERVFEMPSKAQWDSYERIIKEWQKEIVGTDRLLRSKKAVGNQQLAVSSRQSPEGSQQLVVGSQQSPVGGGRFEDERWDGFIQKVRSLYRLADSRQPYNMDQLVIEDDEELSRIGRIWDRKAATGIGSAAVMPIYQNFMLQSFAVGIRKTLEQIKQSLRAYYQQLGLSETAIEEKIREILKNEVFPQLRNTYLSSTIKEGGNRIRTHLALGILDKVKEQLILMAKQKRSIIDVARYLHKNYGGELWYWMRIAKTEAVLAYVAAFEAQSRAAGVKYVQWSALANACEICAAMDGKTWKFEESPLPVVDSHPNCYCILIPLYMHDPNTPLQIRWDREYSPYDLPYEPGEVEERLRRTQPLGDWVW